MTENEKIILNIRSYLEKKDKTAFDDMIAFLRSIEKEDSKLAHNESKLLRNRAIDLMKEDSEFYYSVYRRTLLFDSRVDFDSFLLYVEIDRKRDKQFYSPRRHYLKPMVEGYQEIADGKLQLLTISMPKRAGKSQTGINFVNFLSGRDPYKATLMEGAGSALVDSFYKGILEYWEEPNDYALNEIFPDVKMVQTNADTRIINLKTKSRFPTVMCRSIDATQVGLSEASNLLYLDDCVTGREEAMNRQLLDKKWEIISGDIMGRALEGTPMVFCGTRYSLYDPIGRVQEFAKSSGWKWKAIEIPALDDNDESNYEFERDGKKIFTSQFFREQRDLLSAEQFESEFQQQPFEAKGLVLPPNELNYYFELPMDEPDVVLAVCDTAESGEDSTAMPIAYIYGESVYIVDVVFNNAPPDITKPECAEKLMAHNVTNCTFESNNAGMYFARDIDEIIHENKGRVGIRTKRTLSNKNTRIEFASTNIKRNFYFKDPSIVERGSEYATFFKEATTFTRTGKNKHDDAIDSLSLLENEIKIADYENVEVVKRYF